VIGAAVLCSHKVKTTVKGLGSGVYRIPGSWDNPIVERIRARTLPRPQRHRIKWEE